MLSWFGYLCHNLLVFISSIASNPNVITGSALCFELMYFVLASINCDICLTSFFQCNFDEIFLD